MNYDGIKDLARRRLPKLYPTLVRTKSSAPVRAVRALPGGVNYLGWRNSQPQRIGLDISSPIGMGAIICHALLLHDYFAARGIECHIRATSPFYSNPGEDVLARFFESPPWPDDLAIQAWGTSQFIIEFLRPDHLPLERAQELMQRHFRPSPRLAQAIAEGSKGIAEFDLAIHFRGTDKAMEAVSFGEQDMLDLVARELNGMPTPKVFLATDVKSFAHAVMARFPDAQFVSYDLDDVTSGTARYRSSMAPDDKALEALVNSFLIARAKVCLRTVSYLSAISALINPSMRTITVNRLYGRTPPFPELEIGKKEMAS